MEPDFDILKHQKHANRLLGAFLKSGHIPHALLFTGIEGSGKRDAAFAFAMACNCEESPTDWVQGLKKTVFGPIPCGCCLPCRKIVSGNHPDMILLAPEQSVIKIARIRQLSHELSLKAYEAKRRVAVIVDAPRMTPEAGNALLKMLEEPPPQTLLILTAVQRSDLLPTLVSRCHSIRFHPLPESHIAAVLQNRLGLSADEADALAPMANGSLSRALAMANREAGASKWLNRREAIISASGLDHPETFSFEPLTLSLAFAERLSVEKERIPEALEILQCYLRDFIALRWTSPYLFNKDLTQEMQYVSQHTRLEVLMTQIEAIQRAQRNLTANVNPRLALETMMIHLRNACHEQDCRNPL